VRVRVWVLVLCAIVVVAGSIMDRAAQDPGEPTATTQDVSAAVLAGAKRLELGRNGRTTARVGYHDGPFFLFDRSALAHYRDGRPWTAALRKAKRSGARSGESDGVIAVTTCCGDGERIALTVRRLPGPPRATTHGFDAAAAHDLDLPPATSCTRRPAAARPSCCTSARARTARGSRSGSGPARGSGATCWTCGRAPAERPRKWASLGPWLPGWLGEGRARRRAFGCRVVRRCAGVVGRRRRGRRLASRRRNGRGWVRGKGVAGGADADDGNVARNARSHVLCDVAVDIRR
jgi:hypothetical protein